MPHLHETTEIPSTHPRKEKIGRFSANDRCAAVRHRDGASHVSEKRSTYDPNRTTIEKVGRFSANDRCAAVRHRDGASHVSEKRSTYARNRTTHRKGRSFLRKRPLRRRAASGRGQSRFGETLHLCPKPHNSSNSLPDQRGSLPNTRSTFPRSTAHPSSTARRSDQPRSSTNRSAKTLASTRLYIANFGRPNSNLYMSL